MKKLSIIIPVYFNELNIPHTYQKLIEKFSHIRTFEYEIIFVDDGSQDQSYPILKKLAQKDEKVKLIKLSKNFGSHLAILAGLENATGECATMISADLQDDPQIIIDMFEKWLNGNKVVLAVRKDREESLVQKAISNFYYSLMKKYALSNMPRGGFDCFLIDRQVINILTSIEEKNSSLMGQILWCGFKTAKIYYIRKAREIGHSRWTLSKKIKLFIDSFTAFSYLPIKLITTLGFLIASISFIYAIITLFNRLLLNIKVEGWTTLMVVLLFLSGIQMMMLGIIGEYLWRNFDESRKRPPFIIEEKVNF